MRRGRGARAAAKHVNLKGVHARCACSCNVACNMVGLDPVDDGRGGQSDHRGKTVLTVLTVDHTLLHFTQLPSSCHVTKSEFLRWCFSLPLLTRRPRNLSLPVEDLVQLVFQRLACWSSARPAPGVPCGCSHHGHVACDGGFGLRR